MVTFVPLEICYCTYNAKRHTGADTPFCSVHAFYQTNVNIVSYGALVRFLHGLSKNCNAMSYGMYYVRPPAWMCVVINRILRSLAQESPLIVFLIGSLTRVRIGYNLHSASAVVGLPLPCEETSRDIVYHYANITVTLHNYVFVRGGSCCKAYYSRSPSRTVCIFDNGSKFEADCFVGSCVLVQTTK
jgi:hypothetical protein